MIHRRTFMLTAVMAGIAPAAFGAELISSGEVKGLAGHVASGKINIVDEGGRRIVHLTDNFQFDGGPDVKVALGNNGYDPNTLLAPLASNSGSQTYVIPDSIDPSKYNEIWLWCEKFSVGLAMAQMR